MHCPKNMTCKVTWRNFKSDSHSLHPWLIKYITLLLPNVAVELEYPLSYLKVLGSNVGSEKSYPD
jgi:hypothetical protein